MKENMMPSPEQLKKIQNENMSDEQVKQSKEREATFEAGASAGRQEAQDRENKLAIDKEKYKEERDKKFRERLDSFLSRYDDFEFVQKILKANFDEISKMFINTGQYGNPDAEIMLSESRVSISFKAGINGGVFDNITKTKIANHSAEERTAYLVMALRQAQKLAKEYMRSDYGEPHTSLYGE